MVSMCRALLAGALFVALGSVSAAASPAGDPGPYLHPQRLIDVGGHRMNLYCTGQGSPTVILGTDGDDGTPAWRFVQPLIAKRTRVCSYDGAGLGFSDPITTTLDASTAVTDLHRLLTHAGISSPVVIVGYGISGLYARLYADRYPRDVAGMVLVAPNVTDQRRRLSALAPSFAPYLAQAVPFDRQCTTAAERGEMHPGTPAFSRCMYTPPDPTMPRALAELVQRQWQRPSTWRIHTSMDTETASSAQVEREQRSYGSMPLIVLTTTKDIESLPIPKHEKLSLVRAWIAWHAAMAKLSTQGVNFIVAGSTQSVPIERPAAVVSAIAEVVDQARGHRHGGGAFANTGSPRVLTPRC